MKKDGEDDGEGGGADDDEAKAKSPRATSKKANKLKLKALPARMLEAVAGVFGIKFTDDVLKAETRVSKKISRYSAGGTMIAVADDELDGKLKLKSEGSSDEDDDEDGDDDDESDSVLSETTDSESESLKNARKRIEELEPLFEDSDSDSDNEFNKERKGLLKKVKRAEK